MIEATYLLDTNICIYINRGLSTPLRTRLAELDEGMIAISAITLAELELGVRNYPEQQERLQIFLEEVPVLPFGGEMAKRYAHLPFKRGSFDRLIAAHALVLNLTLVTNNERDFADIPGLRVENWTVA
jgi:tRNA(fMet)-specific endonuclease VapC